ncbi:MAG TPA: hypothetical protein PLX04_00460 [Caldisericia bacterium]|nr:hypothetical protein [Caldisericia bacterium]HOU08489.1 hypothetical protein [Caldisericia bacterium]HPL88721.1 hypothetical protein [Caldisericia bacterium]HQG59918.1 hypothetical protein [Caldisericia bacterium]HQH49358.1 hypothetical protein [Caldisericia bacterium]
MNVILNLRKFVLVLVVFAIIVTPYSSPSFGIQKMIWPQDPFTIIAYEYRSFSGGSFWSFKKPTPMLSYEKGKLTFYEFEIVEDETGKHYSPVLDEYGSPVKVDPADKDIVKKAEKIITSRRLFGKLDGPQGRIALGMFFQEDDNYYKWKYCIFGKDINRSQYISGTDKIYPVGSISYLDGDYNFEVQAYHGYAYQVERREALNPEYYDRYEIPGLVDFGEASYINRQSGAGYLWLSAKDPKVVINTVEHSYTNFALVLSENQIPFVALSFLSDVLFAPMTGDGETYTIQRLYNIKTTEVELVKLTLTKDSKKALIDGKEVELSEPPFMTDTGLFVPLLDVCKLLKANCHYRKTDYSAIVARFFAPMNE